MKIQASSKPQELSKLGLGPGSASPGKKSGFEEWAETKTERLLGKWEGAHASGVPWASRPQGELN